MHFPSRHVYILFIYKNETSCNTDFLSIIEYNLCQYFKNIISGNA
jgi:hypothetical protein